MIERKQMWSDRSLVLASSFDCTVPGLCFVQYTILFVVVILR